ncbi:MAG: alpha-(1-2)-phosphatidylinositol mannosyltransferase [Acidimicrobiaceae bacterium]|jgi:phosphatidylinositol alpha-1,6-mannosyltransferase|nr:alpha-(1-2)-phosphatidylinositol mannosyltransferase [Acidimicrobiaceae bacterium]
MNHLLVTNDYPPKVGGIQSYLWEIYRRLPQEEVTVLCAPHEDSQSFDSEQNHRIIRTKQRFLLPTPQLAKQIRAIVEEQKIEAVLFDPAVPVGILGPKIGIPYGVILHGAEVTIPGRVPVLKQILRRVLRGAKLVVTAGEYSTKEAERAAKAKLPVVIIPPGVDEKRFKPLTPESRSNARSKYNLKESDEVILTLSRLVPRKGMDALIKACAELKLSRPNLKLLVAGTGRDRSRLEFIAKRSKAPAIFLGHVADAEIPTLYGLADLFSMLCRVRWGGLEQEGFGIVFLEAAASGVPQLAGKSGGAGEAVLDGKTGKIISKPKDIQSIKNAISQLLDDEHDRSKMKKSSRLRAETKFSYDNLAIEFHRSILKLKQD